MRDKVLEMKLRLQVLTALGIGFLYYWLWRNDCLGEIWSVVWGNFTIWVALALAGVYGAIWWQKHANFSGKELAVFLVITPFVVFPIVGHIYFWTTDLGDVEMINGAAQSFEYTQRYPVTTKSTDDAISQAIARASETLRNLDWFEVTEVRGHIKDGKVAHWQVGLKIGMRLEGDS